jgi:hypothetical protein
MVTREIGRDRRHAVPFAQLIEAAEKCVAYFRFREFRIGRTLAE